MSLGEYLSIPFFITLGITLLLVGIVGLFFTQRLQEQNHKINSMVGLVSTMAEEVNYLRSRLVQVGGMPANPNATCDANVYNYSLFETDTNKLIQVSDGEEDDEDSDSDSDSDSESGSEDEDEDEASEEGNSANIKVINIHDTTIVPETSIEEIDESDSESDNESDDSKSESSESINLVEMDSSNDLKSLNISLGDYDDKHINVDLSITDYKKLSLNKLRSLVQEKGLSEDANKLKKPELLKLLGSA